MELPYLIPSVPDRRYMLHFYCLVSSFCPLRCAFPTSFPHIDLLCAVIGGVSIHPDPSNTCFAFSLAKALEVQGG